MGLEVQTELSSEAIECRNNDEGREKIPAFVIHGSSISASSLLPQAKGRAGEG